MEPTSQQELKQLLDEGKISQEEYQELKQAMAERDAERKSDCDINIKGDFQLELKSRDLGKIAAILVLGGFILPTLIYFFFDFADGPNSKPNLMLFYFLFGVIELAGFMLGIISWKDSFGKAATITAGILLLLSILFIA